MDAETILRDAEKAVAQQARELIYAQPFWGSLLMHLKRVYTFAVPTMATDGARLYVNPIFVLKLTKGGLRTVLAHEVSHCALRHFDRLEGRDLDRWNRATDFRINFDLVAANFEAPEWTNDAGEKRTWLYDRKYARDNSEAIYAKLAAEDSQKPNQPKPQPGQPGQPGKGGQSSPGNGNPQPGSGNQPGKPGDSGKPSQGQPGKAPGKGASGAASGNGAQPGNGQGEAGAPAGELPSALGDDFGMGGILPAPEPEPGGLSPADLATTWEVRIRQAVAQADKYKGTVPGSVRDLIERLNRPKVDWKAKLREYVGEARSQEEQWSRPSRRFIGQGLIVPSRPYEAISKILFMADTSLSMARDELRASFSEAQSFLDEGLCEVLQWACVDTRVASHGELLPGDSFEGFKTSGGGGTNFASAMQWAAEQEPQLIILFTDGETLSWGEAPACPVVVMGAKRFEANLAKCPYGDALPIEL
jgi:predicted metal-dependent peptidase